MDEGDSDEKVASFGRLSDLAKRYTLASLESLAGHREALLTSLTSSDGAKDALSSIEAWQAAIELDDAIAQGIEESSILAKLAGYLFVAEVEEGAVSLALDIDFFNMPFEEAIAFFKAKSLISAEEFDRLTAAARKNAFIARRLLSETLARTARDGIESALSNGDTYRTYAERLISGDASLGVEPESAAYIEMVYRTNVQGSYMAGKWKASTSPAVMKARPYLVFRATQDARTRESHAKLHNKAVHKDSPLAGRISPPLGFGCRCGFVNMSLEQVQSRGYEILSDMPEGAGADDPTFDVPPTENF